MLQQTIASITGQAYPIDKLEVIVVSQTPEIEHTSLTDNNDLSLKVVLRDEKETISALRNRGVELSSGEYLAFLDADIFISENWVSCMLQHLQSASERVVVSAMQVCDDNAPPLEHIRTSLSNAEIDVNVAFLPGRNLFLSRQTFDEIGGFPEHLVTCEDYYFTDKANGLGKLYYTSSATYIHLGEDKSFSEMFKKELWRGQSNLQSIQGRRVPLREIPSFVLPLGICLSLVVSLISVVFQAYPLSMFFLFISITPLLAYAIRLYQMSKHVVNFASVVKFYAIYFPARAIGTLAGLFKTIGANHK